MQPENQTFKISTGLKDLIGRGLITDDFVAIFELVKNSFDAHARNVQLRFERHKIVVADDGKGMSNNDILDKWLFVAYSAKRDGTEDADYRNRIHEKSRAFAGSKGVGRFSCDRLGKCLLLSSKTHDSSVQNLAVDWGQFEVDLKQEFGSIQVKVSETDDFPHPNFRLHGKSGTVLEITELRATWNRAKLQELKRELAKLIDPFSTKAPIFHIEIIAPDEKIADDEDEAFNKHLSEGQENRTIVNGDISNSIIEVLGQRTTVIRASIVENGTKIETILEDRGELIYKIREPNPYFGLTLTELYADVYFLNRSAKIIFAHRMGLPSIRFGSIFLFRNGFRVFPVGTEDDDFFGLNRRKQQGYKRFLGGRDLIGRIDIRGADGFEEATSRNQGLIRTDEVAELIHFIQNKCVRRLERYIVDISWKDKFDQDSDTAVRIHLDKNSALVTQLVSRLAATENVELLNFNPEIIRIIDDKSDQFEGSLEALEVLAGQIGDKELLAKIANARARLQALEAAELEAREAERRAQLRARAAEAQVKATEEKLVDERARNQFLVAASSLDEDTILNLHHQIIIHAADVHHQIERMMGKLRSKADISRLEWIDFLESVSYRNSQILTGARFATKAGYKQQSAELTDDLAGYIRDYIETVSALWAPRGISVQVVGDMKTFVRKFKPIEVGILIDNLVSNAKKAKAARIQFSLSVSKGENSELTIDVADDGTGWSKKIDPLSEIFEKGVTTTDGSGLGLSHVKQVIERMSGKVQAFREKFSDEFDGAFIKLTVTK